MAGQPKAQAVWLDVPRLGPATAGTSAQPERASAREAEQAKRAAAPRPPKRPRSAIRSFPQQTRSIPPEPAPAKARGQRREWRMQEREQSPEPEPARPAPERAPEALTEARVLDVLRAVARRSPEADDLLRDVRRQLDAMRESMKNRRFS